MRKVVTTKNSILKQYKDGSSELRESIREETEDDSKRNLDFYAVIILLILRIVTTS